MSSRSGFRVRQAVATAIAQRLVLDEWVADLIAPISSEPIPDILYAINGTDSASTSLRR